MTIDQAKEVMKIAVAGAVARDLEPERYQFLMRHLLPLPYERTRDAVHRYVVGHKWVSSLAELCEAADVPPGAAGDLTRAIREGGALVRDLRALSGWSYVAPGDPLPQGAVEAAAVAAEPELAEPPVRRILPAPVPDIDARVRALAAAKRVVNERAPAAGPSPEVIEAELAEADTRFRREVTQSEART